MSPMPEEQSSKEDEAGVKQVPSHGISIDVPSEGDSGRPPNLRHMYNYSSQETLTPSTDVPFQVNPCL